VSDLVAAHILGQQRIRLTLERAIERIWGGLPGYDRADVEQWLKRVIPVVLASQRRSIALTDAFIARKLERGPLGLDANALLAAAVRPGVSLEEQWSRPFVTHWSALKEGKPYEESLAGALARAKAAGALDVQLAMRAAAEGARIRDPQIGGFRRVADGGACDFCLEVDGAIVKSALAMPLHNHCGCGLEPLTESVDPTPAPPSVAVHEHGELGPVLADPAHDFSVV
jgi:hypothetical protein